MQTKPTDLNPVDERLLELQNEVREHFGWELQADVDSALAGIVEDLKFTVVQCAAIAGENCRVHRHSWPSGKKDQPDQPTDRQQQQHEASLDPAKKCAHACGSLWA